LSQYVKKTVIIAVFMEQTGYTKDDVLSQVLKYCTSFGNKNVVRRRRTGSVENSGKRPVETIHYLFNLPTLS